MSIRLIRKSDEDILRKKSRQVLAIDDRIITLLDDLADTMHSANGLGLAAVQVGVLRRVAVVDTGDALVELINPVIVKTEGGEVGLEGCLSFPGKYGEVERPTKVWVQSLDRKGKKKEYYGEDLVARAFCHEIDHMDGNLFVDLVSKFVDVEETV